LAKVRAVVHLSQSDTPEGLRRGAHRGACKCPFAVRPVTLGRGRIRSSG
jgi:hypothetical protein